ncbi:MAG: hypothetical protein KAW84_02195 [Thermoplasmata archaeon]|nr:hypothetical protein [Thermoplasmata archaeon]
MARKLHTPAGLKYGSYLIVLLILADVLFLFMSVPTATAGAQSSVVLTLCCFIGIILVVLFIFFLLFLYEMHRGKREFGKKHESKASTALILIILSIILFVVSFVVLIIGMASAIMLTPDGTDPTIEIDAAGFRNQIIIFFAFLLATTITMSLALVYYPLELTEQGKRWMLWTGFGLQIFPPVLSMILVVASLPGSGVLDLDEVEQLDMNTAISYATYVVSLLGMILFFIAYRAARQRILDGKIQPVLAQPVQPPPPMAPPPTWGQEPPPATVEEPPKWEELEPVDEPKE